jgi:hypothetical protein
MKKIAADKNYRVFRKVAADPSPRQRKTDGSVHGVIREILEYIKQLNKRDQWLEDGINQNTELIDTLELQRIDPMSQAIKDIKAKLKIN